MRPTTLIFLASLAVTVVAFRLHAWTVAGFAGWPVLLLGGYSSAVRANGRQMVTTGAHRLVRGRW